MRESIIGDVAWLSICIYVRKHLIPPPAAGGTACEAGSGEGGLSCGLREIYNKTKKGKATLPHTSTQPPSPLSLSVSWLDTYIFEQVTAGTLLAPVATLVCLVRRGKGRSRHSTYRYTHTQAYT